MITPPSLNPTTSLTATSIGEEPKKNWSFIFYIKEIATNGKVKDCDNLLCGEENYFNEAV